MSLHRSIGPSAPHEEAGESAPLWVISFADMVTLLMSFFVLMMASTPKGQTSEAPNAELLKVLASIKMAFHYTPNPASKDPLDQEILRVLSQRDKDAGAGGGVWWKAPGIKGTSPEVRELWKKAQTGIGEPVPFEPGSAELTGEKQWALIADVAEVVRDHYRILVIRGHVNSDEAADEPDGGFELAYRRGAAVKDALANTRIAHARLRVVSCGPYEPVLGGEQTEEQLAANRRAEITLGAQFLPGTYHRTGDAGTAD